MKTKPFLHLYLFLIILLLTASCSKNSPTNTTDTLEEAIDEIANKYLEVGMVIGIINSDQEKMIFSYGTKVRGTDDTPDENTVFDIGSMTKTFTSLLVADSYLNGGFTDDTVSHYLPENVTMPTLNGTPIRIVHLATHTSGLPRNPLADGQIYPIPDGYDEENPYEVYTTEDVYDYLTNYCTLLFEPGTFWEYSNTGYGLLGHLVGLVNNSTYRDVLQDKIFDELGMNRSSVFLTDDQLTNYSLGYNTDKENVPYFVANDIFQGAGFIKSTLSDLFKYLEANMGMTETTLRSSMDLTHEPQLHQGSMGEQALAWFVQTLDDGQTIIYSGGNTIGHSSYIGFNKSASTGVIILTNDAMHGSQLNMGSEILEAINQY